MSTERLTKDMLIMTAVKFYAMAKEFMGKSDAEMLRGVAAKCHAQLLAGAPLQSVPQPLYFETSEGTLSLLGLPRWVHYGLPTITMGHRYAAALLSTTATVEAVREARAPFPAFMIELPDQLLFTDDPDKPGERITLRRILVQRIMTARGEAWGWVAYTDGKVSLYRHGQNSEELLPPEEIEGDKMGDPSDPFQFDVTDRDERTIYLLGRLIVNTCLAMSDPTNIKAIGKAHTDWEKYNAGSKRGSPEPVVRIFQLGKPVKHDCREAVREYVEGRRRKLSVQVLVRGHYKTQHYGPKNSQIKVIWREPFWRGPEDAPIPVREHVLGVK